MKYRMLKVGDKRPNGYQMKNIELREWVDGLSSQVGVEITSNNLKRLEYRVPIRPKKARKK